MRPEHAPLASADDHDESRALLLARLEEAEARLGHLAAAALPPCRHDQSPGANQPSAAVCSSSS